VLDETRRQQEEVNKKRVQDQRKRMEEVRKQQQEAANKRQEEQQKRVEAMKKQQEVAREEQRAASAIRKVMQKIKAAKLEEFEGLESELHCALEKELENCGSQKDALAEESKKALEQAKQRVSLLKDQKRKIEEKRAAEEVRRKEAQEQADALLVELNELVGAAEAAAEAIKEKAAAFDANSKLATADAVCKAAEVVKEADAEVQLKVQACTDFIAAKRINMAASAKGSQAGVLAPKIGQEKEETVDSSTPALAALQRRLSSCKSEAQKTFSNSMTEKDKKEKRIKARELADQDQKSFKKHDKDRDGALSRQEVLQYAKSECGITLPSKTVDLIFDVLVDDGAKGVSSKDIQRLKVMIGVAREKERDVQRREERLVREKELAASKVQLEEKVKEIAGMCDSFDEALKKAEGLMKAGPEKDSDAKAEAALNHASQVEEAMKEAKDLVTATMDKINSLSEGLETSEHRAFLKGEVRKLQRRMKGLDTRSAKVAAWLKKARADAKKKVADELEGIRARALSTIRWYQQLSELKIDALFAEFDANSDGSIDESDFLGFFRKCEERRRSKDAEAEGKDSEPGPSAEDAQKLFVHLNEEGEKSIPQEAFMRFIRRYMKVVKGAVMSAGIGIKEKVVRRLEVKEVVEVIEGPIKVEDIGVQRIHAKSMADGATGWITLAGNLSSVYLEEGGSVFKCVKETILTDAFELAAVKDASRKLHDTTRKLTPGELVEVYEWPKLEEASGLTRMRCRAKSDGLIGWATTVGNKGAVFLEAA